MVSGCPFTPQITYRTPVMLQVIKSEVPELRQQTRQMALGSDGAHALLYVEKEKPALGRGGSSHMRTVRARFSGR